MLEKWTYGDGTTLAYLFQALSSVHQRFQSVTSIRDATCSLSWTGKTQNDVHCQKWDRLERSVVISDRLQHQRWKNENETAVTWGDDVICLKTSRCRERLTASASKLNNPVLVLETFSHLFKGRSLEPFCSVSEITPKLHTRQKSSVTIADIFRKKKMPSFEVFLEKLSIFLKHYCGEKLQASLNQVFALYFHWINCIQLQKYLWF